MRRTSTQRGPASDWDTTRGSSNVCRSERRQPPQTVPVLCENEEMLSAHTHTQRLWGPYKVNTRTGTCARSLNDFTVRARFPAAQPPKSTLPSNYWQALNTGLVCEKLKTAIHHSQLGQSQIDNVQSSRALESQIFQAGRARPEISVFMNESRLLVTRLSLWIMQTHDSI